MKLFGFNIDIQKATKDNQPIDVKVVNQLERKKEIETQLESLDNNIEVNYIKANMLLEQAREQGDAVLFQKAVKTVQNIEVNYVKENAKARLEGNFTNVLNVFGYKEKTTQISWRLLEQMANYPIIRMIHRTIINDLARFTKPQIDKFSTGYYFEKKDGSPITDKEKSTEIKLLNDLILNCGYERDKITGTFEKFMRMWSLNSLTYDHAPVEKIRNNKGQLVAWRNLPSYSIHFADTYNEQEVEAKGLSHLYGEKNGKLPAYVQVFDSIIYSEFYNDELWLSLRNPSASTTSNYYGRSELEDLIQIVTYLANSIRATGDTFDSGFMGRGILNIKGGASAVKLNELKNYFRATAAGIKGNNALLVTDSERAEYIKIQESNKDMEYSNFIILMVSIVTGLYALTPESIGLSGQTKANINYESGTDERIKTTNARALEPILNNFADGFSDNIINEFFEGRYRFCFGGIHAETQMQNIEKLQKKMTVMPFGEILKENNLPELTGKLKALNNIVMNPSFLQAYGLVSQQGGQGGDGGQTDNQNGSDVESPQDEQSDIEKSITINDFENYFKTQIIDSYNESLQ